MIDGNQLREEFGRYLAEHKATRWGMDAALMHVCKIAYDAGKADGPGEYRNGAAATLDGLLTDHIKETERLLEQYDDACLGIIGMSEEQARAALLAHIQRGAVPEGWKEATIAWEVCASIHREYAKKKDPFFTTRQADFVRHTEAARAALLATTPDQFRDATKMVPAPAEVPMPQGYVERPSDYTGDIWIESQMLTYGERCRAAGEAAGYARGVRGERDECAALCRNIYSWPGAYYAGPMDTATLKAAASAIEARSGPKVGKRAALRGEVKP